VAATTSGFAPGYRARTITVGGATSGKEAIGKRITESNPTRTMKIEITDANIGLRMKKRENFITAKLKVYVQ